jgi:hypothetical protein
MHKLTSGYGVALLMAVAQNTQAAPFALEARSLAMGNVSVATADIATAAFANPAMLVYQKNDDDFALLLPTVGVLLDDSDGLLNKVDDFQVISDAYLASGTPSGATEAQLAAIASSMIGNILSPQVSGGIALGFAGEAYALAFSARSNVFLAGGLDGASTDFTLTGLNDPTRNLLNLEGVRATELGVSIAGKFALLGTNIAIGITPKSIQVDRIGFTESVATLSDGVGDLLDEQNINDLGSITTMDAGIVLGLGENIQLGAIARNLISGELRDGAATIKYGTELRAGLAYRGDFFTLGADLDLTENDAVLSLFPQAKTRMLSLGAEFNAFNFAQLRVGMQKNIASGITEGAKKQLLTAGIGFWFGFHLDVSAAAAEDVLGVFVQTGFRF